MLENEEYIRLDLSKMTNLCKIQIYASYFYKLDLEKYYL